MPVTLFSYRLIFVKENCFSLRLFLNFSHEIDNITQDPDLQIESKLDQNSGSGSKFNVFGSTTQV